MLSSPPRFIAYTLRYEAWHPSLALQSIPKHPSLAQNSENVQSTLRDVYLASPQGCPCPFGVLLPLITLGNGPLSHIWAVLRIRSDPAVLSVCGQNRAVGRLGVPRTPSVAPP